MELLQLQYFKVLAEREHVAQTAQSLRISPPSLSATITRLEREIGVQLFDRKGRTIRLNECGRVYLKHVNQIFSSLENAKLEVHDAANRQGKHLSIAINSPTIWQDATQAFIKEHPHIVISHTIININQLDDPSYSSQFDFIITSTTDMTGNDWDWAILMPDDMPLFAVYPRHPFAQRKAVHFVDAKDENFIVLSKGFPMRKFFDDFCAISGFSPKIVIECDYMLRSRMLAAEYGIVLTTKSGSHTTVLSNAVIVEIIEPALRSTTAIICNKRRYLSRDAIEFKDFMVNFYDKHDKPPQAIDL
jgi:LysR family transcriptional regulator, transcription activator of glutamate synthase operon